jgi:hypothetical protein
MTHDKPDTLFSLAEFIIIFPETHIKRQATLHDCLSVSSLLTVRKTIFCTGPTRATKAGQKISCTRTKSPMNQSRKGPCHLYSLKPHLPQFQQLAGATPIYSLNLFLAFCMQKTWRGVLIFPIPFLAITESIILLRSLNSGSSNTLFRPFLTSR